MKLTNKYGDEFEAHDLGGDTYAVWSRNHDDEVIGLTEFHMCNGEISGGAVMFVLGYGPTSLWHIEAGTVGEWEGLTLSPSIACHECGHHGWIRDGEWVSA